MLTTSEPFTSLDGLYRQPNCRSGVHDGPKVAMPGDRLVNGAGVSRRRRGQSTVRGAKAPLIRTAVTKTLLAQLRWAIDRIFETDRLPVGVHVRSDSGVQVPSARCRRSVSSTSGAVRRCPLATISSVRLKQYETCSTAVVEYMDKAALRLAGSNPARPASDTSSGPELCPKPRRVQQKSPTACRDYI